MFQNVMLKPQRKFRNEKGDSVGLGPKVADDGI
jgi:hypothetical protein